MEYRQLGASGLNVPVLSFGTGTFGGGGDFFKAWGNTQTDEAARLVNLCLDAGITLFDTANVYSQGLSEEILGKAIIGLRDKIILSTKATFKMGSGPNDFGSSRFHLIKSCEDSLRRLKTDYIDIYHMHGFDGNTPVEETLSALNDLITAGKVRYIACSNFSGWHLMKSLSVSEKYGWSRYIAHQAHYSLISREFEWELMPLGVDQNIGTIVWSPLSAGRLGGKYRRGQPIPPEGRIAQGGGEGPEVSEEFFFHLIDVLDEVAAETEKTVAQVALNWLLQRPTVSNVVIGARNEEQLRQNLGAVGWNLNLEQVKKLDAASDKSPVYPYWHQRKNTALNPLPDFYGKVSR
ncbi:aldo/keto reductase [Dyadobacter chenwenxiniae]|uniref:Aldo/keto reductase n=1 Tax=Dyadobacter chenwenxiniae TaxID=2906456 RepID=A0A9X1PMM2_9BACT|nr:aldo/keto reductase [Dyadobacter chenwenxiniae]MCF0063631.1 aldo/keto reductase [Dyadobacter chenwenxiniae]UON83307.1 aldo/keto reductase [Dyadobacter chenwenxiniae]